MCQGWCNFSLSAVIMKSTEVQTLSRMWQKYGIFGLKTLLYAYVLGEHTSKLYIVDQYLKSGVFL